MKQLIASVTTGLFRSRVGLALMLAVVIFGIVGAAQLLSGTVDPDSTLGNHPSRPITTVDPSTGDDGALSVDLTPTPSNRPGAAPPEAVARDFASAWLRHNGVSAKQWHEALVPNTTKDLADKLAGVDPTEVPAEQLTGEPSALPRTESLVDVTIPVNTGQLHLQLVVSNGRWLVDGVDWERE